MQYLNTVAATAFLLLLLFACNSNTPSSVSQKNQNAKLKNTIEGISTKQVLNSNLSEIPVDGKLRPEHLRMYVAIKIKQEQFRFDHTVNNNGTNNSFSNSGHASSISLTVSDFEKAAINHFEFNSQLYHWTRKAIKNTLNAYTDFNLDLQNTVSNPENSVVIHNLSVIKNFSDELNFADRYQLGTNNLVTVSHAEFKPHPASPLTTNPRLN